MLPKHQMALIASFLCALQVGAIMDRAHVGLPACELAALPTTALSGVGKLTAAALQVRHFTRRTLAFVTPPRVSKALEQPSGSRWYVRRDLAVRTFYPACTAFGGEGEGVEKTEVRGERGRRAAILGRRAGQEGEERRHGRREREQRGNREGVGGG